MAKELMDSLIRKIIKTQKNTVMKTLNQIVIPMEDFINGMR